MLSILPGQPRGGTGPCVEAGTYGRMPGGRTEFREKSGQNLENEHVFDSLVAELRSWPAVDRPRVGVKEGAFDIEAFFDAYFSNYIEGTEFEVDEAVGIVFEHRIPAQRPKDAHDILCTYRLLSHLRNIFPNTVTKANDLNTFPNLLL